MTRSIIKPAALLLAAAFAQQAAASGYHFGTQSVSSQATANAAAAEAADAGTLFYNPAGLSKLEENQISAAVNVVAPSIHYGEAQATHYRTGAAVSGSTSGTITDSVVVAPHIYGAYRLNDRTTLGLGVYVPFGSSTEYDEDSVLRYNINKLGLTSIAVEPAISFKLNERHAVALGLIAQYSKAELRKFADWDASGAVSQVASAAATAATGTPTRVDMTGRADGYAEVKGNDWGFGYHLGWLWDVNDRVRVGVNYRSKVEHNLKGTADWHATGAGVTSASALLGGRSLYDAVLSQPITANAGTALQGRGYVASEDASVKIVTPESLSVHGMFKANDKLNLFGDITWTRHSRFNQAELIFANRKVVANGSTSDRTVITPNWRNTYKVALGASYQITEPLQLRAGIAFDQSPVRSAASRLNTLPDGNRIWFSAGVKYNINRKHSVDVAYSHIHINDTEFNAERASGSDVDSKGTAYAKFKNHADILGVQYTYKF